jgi:anti-sigma-K factor RskA
MFYALELPEAPQGKTYQLWAIADGEPKSAGVFSVDEKGNYVHVIKSLKDIGNVSAFAVSVEPAGGVTLPTGKIVLMGETRL